MLAARGMWMRAGIVLLTWLVSASTAAAGDRTVVVLLFDGWAPAIVDAAATPTLDRIRRDGAWTHELEPVFPSISLTNQVSISTGCRPARHGIVSNEFLDPQRGRYDHDHDADWLLGCEHLHQVAERQGVRAAALGWVGRFSGSRGDLATVASTEREWDEFPSDEERAQEVIRLLRLPDAERPRLIAAYFKGPDNSAHFNGIDAEATIAAATQSDARIGDVLGAIEPLPFRDAVTLLITTDHGMLPVSTNVNVRKILANHAIEATAVSSGTTAHLYLADGAELDRAYAALAGYQQFAVAKRDAQPAAWHLGTTARVGDLVLSAKPPYFIEDIARWPSWTQWLGTWGPEFLWAGFAIKATHGYPPDTPGMAGILYAWGAGIRPGAHVSEVRAIDVHPTVCKLLAIEPGSPVDGLVATQLLVNP